MHAVRCPVGHSWRDFSDQIVEKGATTVTKESSIEDIIKAVEKEHGKGSLIRMGNTLKSFDQVGSVHGINFAGL